MPSTNEAFSRVRIDTQLKDQGWDVLDTNAVRFEYALPDKSKADYVLCDRHGRALAVVEAKRAAISPGQAQAQARGYARQLGVPYIFLANGEEIAFWEWQRDAFPRPVKTFFSQADLERRAATAQVQRDPLAVPIDPRIAGRDYQIDCVDTLCREMAAGRRKLLVEMATGTGKTRTAAALIKRLFEAGRLTRVLFLVDRIPLARQTEDAFAEHVPDIPAYVLRAGRRFQDEKRITITTHAKHGGHLPRLLGGLLRPGDLRRMPPLHLRQVERRAAAFRRHPDRPDGDALRDQPGRPGRCRGLAFRARHTAFLRGGQAHVQLPHEGRHP